MLYEELLVKIDIDNPIDVLSSVGRAIDGRWIVITDDGIFHAFDEDGHEIDIEDANILELTEKHIPKDMKKVVISDGVESIGYHAFYNCVNLTSVTIPDSITSIEEAAFSTCTSLMNMTIPNSVTHIKNYAFWNCNSLTNVTIPNSVISIGASTFSWCSGLTSVTIGNSVKYIGFQAFADCRSLEEIIFKGKTIEEVKKMENYPFEIEDESIIRCNNFEAGNH